MANNFGSNPVLFDTDFSNFGALQQLQAAPFGLRVWKIALYVNTTSVAGTVTVTDSVTGIPFIAPMVVPAASTAGTIIYYDNPTQLMNWLPTFAVTGLTATSTKLMVWYRV